MNICSLVVHANPTMAAGVEAHLAALPGVEIHASEGGKLIVTVEDTEKSSAADTMMSFNEVKGVINSVLVYHYGGDEPMGEEVI